MVTSVITEFSYMQVNNHKLNNLVNALTKFGDIVTLF